ncbi:ankyrin repeat domain-containing protein [Streptomyces sp. NPDC047974]|uniref:ankyrin repeat domain-containing protein n=1 Tax=Streptomyces sp. NPDC047974 TaxID=3154343 RepID=UPI0033DDE476
MDDGTRLAAAVRQGDAAAVAALLEAGADPDTVMEDGLPVLCAAIAAFDAAVAQALMEGGADPDRTLPDGTTPLTRAVEGGSPAVVTEVLGREPRLRLMEDERARLLDLAASWCARDVEEELRYRADDSGPVRRAFRRLDPQRTPQPARGTRTPESWSRFSVSWRSRNTRSRTPRGCATRHIPTLACVLGSPHSYGRGAWPPRLWTRRFALLCLPSRRTMTGRCVSVRARS